MVIYIYKEVLQMAKKRVTYTLDEELIKRLREYSDKTMIPQAKIVNEALIEYLNKNESTKQ
jgi:predicted DNA-binding protein